MVISWPAADRAMAYEVEWRRDSGEWVSLPRTTSLSAEVPGIYAGSYVARVRAFNSINLVSRNVESAPTQLDGNLGPPPDVEWFYADDDVLTWSDVVDAELAGYQIRFHYGQNSSWGDATPLHNGILLASPYQVLTKPAGALTLMIKAVNRAGQYSAAPAIILQAFGDQLVANVVEEFDFQAMGFPGELTGGSVVGDALRAEGTAAFWGNDVADFFGADSDPFYVDNYEVMTYITPPIIPTSGATGSKMTLDLDIAGSAVRIEYRLSGSDPFWSGDDGAEFFGPDADPFYADSAPWQPWPGNVIAQRAEYQFRFTTGTGAIEGVISTCRAVIDVPDIEEKLNDVPIVAGGTRLPLAKLYSVIKNVQLTLQDSGTGATSIRILDKSATLGPMVACYNKDNVPVSGVVDATVQGYYQ